MQGYSLKNSLAAVFMTISLALIFAPAAGGGDDFREALDQGRRHGEEMLSRHSSALNPSSPQTVPGYGEAERQEFIREGERWTGNPEGMREEGAGRIQSGDPVTSDAAGHLKQSSAKRPASPETGSVTANSEMPIESPSCGESGVCETEVRCAEGDECFDTQTAQSADFPEVASRMAMLDDMERCLATTRDGESSAEGYGPIEVDEATGATAGPIDCADVSGGGVTIFKGKRYRCDLNLAGFVQNCCAKEGIFSGACPRSTKELRARRDGAGACHYIGIHRKKVFGITVKKRRVYCCFNSRMARVVHEQTRGQLIRKGLWPTAANGGWGRAKSPHCGGMTTEQLQEIDFDAVDFSEIYEGLVDTADTPGLSESAEGTVEDIEDMCPDESLGCGGEGER